MMEKTGLRLIFAGTPTFAAAHLDALLKSPHQILAAYTQPDRPAGRGKRLAASAVKELAFEHGLPVRQPPSLKTPEAQAELAAFDADLMIVVAYGLILPQAVLDIPRFGCINVHGSLLPRWRGAAPVQRAIEAGDSETGVTIMQMDAGLDTGPMLLKSRCPIERDDTSASVFEKLTELGPAALLTVLEQRQSGALKPEAQDEALATYASKIQKEEAAIQWRESAVSIHRKICAFYPAPVAFAELDGERIKIQKASVVSESAAAKPGSILEASEAGIRVACGEQQLLIRELQLPGKKALPAADVLRGYAAKFAEGRCFHSAQHL